MRVDLNPKRGGFFPMAQRAMMFHPVAFAKRSWADIEAEVHRVAEELGPCNRVLAGVGPDVPDEKTLRLAHLCARISGESEGTAP